jgi:hypothetical protein
MPCKISTFSKSPRQNVLEALRVSFTAQAAPREKLAHSVFFKVM